MVWPHPAGEPWAHALISIPNDPQFPDCGGILEAPKRGVRIDFIPRWLDSKRGLGLPDMRDPSWVIGDPQPVPPEEIAAEPDYNTWLFSSPDDYRRRGMGIVTAWPPAKHGRAGEAYARACMSLAKAIPGRAERQLFDEANAAETASLVPPPSTSGTGAVTPVWYRPGSLIVGRHEPTRSWFEVWPHPVHASRVHVIVHVCSPWLPAPIQWTHFELPPDGIGSDELEGLLERAEVANLPWQDGAAWAFTYSDMRPEEAAALRPYILGEKRAASKAGKAVKK
jgi:hypothetical protein